MKLLIGLIHGSSTDDEEYVPQYVNDFKERLRKVHYFASNKHQLTSDRVKVRFLKESGAFS